ncbi:MAG: hypothetical protein DMG15_11430 [Acidobacteria bacterium]|nr:MAG: hypothetical protein DMG16_13960 [Acidobacteriota bacterium]PYS13344.1 MAG: hypothetical protein DMG15_11430 [Acidobacteriota bacterium]
MVASAIAMSVPFVRKLSKRRTGMNFSALKSARRSYKNVSGLNERNNFVELLEPRHVITD